MGLARSTFYDVAPVPLEPAELVARIGAICDEFECYGYRRVGAALRHQGVVVNSKKLRRLMREHDLQNFAVIGGVDGKTDSGVDPDLHVARGRADAQQLGRAVDRGIDLVEED